MAEIDPQAATIITLNPWDPYPTGAPPDGSSVPLRTHTRQEMTSAANWTGQRIANLAAGGMIAGGAPWP